MNELALKYGCNPNQKPSRIYMEDGSDLPVTVLNGKPGYINFLDALNSIQLVKELKAACGLPAAASFKHVSPGRRSAGAAPDRCGTQDVPHCARIWSCSPLANAYARARGADRMSSFGDWIALSRHLRCAHRKADPAARCPTASSPRATSRRHWLSCPARKRATTM